MYYILIYRIIFLSALVGNNDVVLTQPKSELLIHHQDTFYLYGELREDFPLGALFLKHQYKEKLQNQIDTTCWSSACSREFIGIWHIVNDKLYLKELRHCCSEDEINLNTIFRDRKIKKHGVMACWVTEELSVSDNFSSLFNVVLGLDDIKWYDIKVDKGKVKYFKETPF